MTDTQGRYGTLRLISTKSGKAVSSFPVDVDVLTFGRDISCDVRMYFVAVSLLHAKLVFEDSKPFLSVMGAGGVIVNGHQILPSAGSGEPAIVPLQDHSSFTIHNKIFRFDYPPASPARPMLSTPQAAKPRRSLRMSMVNAALIMTPNTRVTPTSPSLETLQSPVKPFINEAKTRVEREQEVVLAEGDDVLVVKQGGDLVVTETFRADEESGLKEANNNDRAEEDSNQDSRGRSPQRALFPSQPSNVPGSSPGSTSTNSSNLQPPVLSTPSRRSRSSSRFSLHKAVLVRNSQRAILDKNDQEEVTSVIAAEGDIGPYSSSAISLDEEVEALEREQSGTVDVQIAGENEGDDAEPNSEDIADTESDQDIGQENGLTQDQNPPRRSLSLRASIEAIGNALIAPFSGRWSGGEAKQGEDDDAEIMDDQSEIVIEDVNDAEVVEPHQENEQDMSIEEATPAETEEVPSTGDGRSDQRSAEVEDPPPPTFSTGEPPLELESAFKSNEISFRPFYTPQPRRTINTQQTSLASSSGDLASSRKSRRMRFSNFGLPDYIVNTTVADIDDEVDQILKQEDEDPPATPSLAPVTPPRQISSHNLPNTETKPISALDSLRKLSRHLEIDNAKRANRLSFGLSPMRLQASPYRPSLEGASPRPTLDPIASQRDAEDVMDTAEEDGESDGSSDAEGDENLPPSPTQIKGLPRDPSSSTPLRSLPLSSTASLRTPSFTGFRNLFAQPKKPPPTPSFVGVRQLFNSANGDHAAVVPSTPSFSGVPNMFALPEEDYTDEARDATPKPVPRRFATPAANSIASSAAGGVTGSENLAPLPARRTRSCSRSHSAAPQPAAEGASRPPSRAGALGRELTPTVNSTTTGGVTGTENLPIRTQRSRSRSRSTAAQPAVEGVARSKAPRQPSTEALTRSDPPPSKSSSRNSANLGVHVSRSGRRRTPAAESTPPALESNAQENTEPAPSRPTRARTPLALEVTITTRSPKLSPKFSPVHPRTIGAASGSKRVHTSDTEEDGRSTTLPRVTRSSERNGGRAAPMAEAAKDAHLEDPALTDKPIESPTSGKTRKRARNVRAATPEKVLDPVVQIPASPKRSTRLPVRSARGRSVSRGAAPAGPIAPRRVPPRNKNEDPEEAGSDEEVLAVSAATRSSTRVATSASKTSTVTPTATGKKTTSTSKAAIPASEPAPVRRTLRIRSTGKK